MMRFGVYKRNQGRVTRQVTFAALAGGLAIGFWRLSQTLTAYDFGLQSDYWRGAVHFGAPGLLLLIGWWVAYRAVNLPSFADFLIAVEAEMNKVSWPSRSELFRASLVVLITIIVLAAVLATYDMIWVVVFHALGIR
jgi:preprotein translocase subunit SecE